MGTMTINLHKVGKSSRKEQKELTDLRNTQEAEWIRKKRVIADLKIALCYFRLSKWMI